MSYEHKTDMKEECATPHFVESYQQLVFRRETRVYALVSRSLVISPVVMASKEKLSRRWADCMMLLKLLFTIY